MLAQVILRLTIWFLLTANFGITNIIIGLLIAFLLPRGYPSRVSAGEWLQMAIKVLKAVPQAYIEAFEMLFRPHDREEIVREPVPLRRKPGLIFLDIFLITFTPKTIVLKYNQEGWYEVHQVRRGNKG
jgi:multicomponent Na+:H+ antiporter subunit E